MGAPKKLDVKKPVKLIFAGGFLGSGKTTALGALAKRIISKDLHLGIITNDQSGNLADTVIVRQMLEELNVPVEEVVKGCFCCKFDELVDQMEKILNKIDLIDDTKQARLTEALKKEFPEKKILTVSAKKGTGMDDWLEILLSGRPGAGTVLREIDYDRYAAAEAVLGWLNAAIKLTAPDTIEPVMLLTGLLKNLQTIFKEKNAGIGHLKCALTSGGKSIWGTLTGFDAEPSLSDKALGKINSGTLLINARVKLEPEELEPVVRDTLKLLSKTFRIETDIIDLQCFSPAYPTPPYLMREGVDS